MTYPKGEIVWAGYYNRAGDLLYIITSKEARDQYYLYECNGDTFQRIGRAKSPPELVERFHIYEKMRESIE